MRRTFALLLALLLALPFGSHRPAAAAVSSSGSSIQYSGNGATAGFPFPYPYFVAGDLQVSLFNTATNSFVSPAPQLNGGGAFDYTVAGVSAFSFATNNVIEFASATISFNTAPPGGDTVIIQRSLAATQTLNLLDNAKLPASSLNASLDRLTMLSQQLRTLVGNVVQAPISDPAGLNYTLPPVGIRASQYACFDSLGNVGTCAPSSGVIVSSPMAPVVGASSLSTARQLLAGNKTLDDIASAAWAQGDVAYYNGTDLARLPAGSAGQALVTNGAGANPAWGNPVLVPPQGRCTLTSGAPVMTGDVVSGTVFYAPYIGGSVPVYNGTAFVPVSFAQLSEILDATGHTSGHNYDVFAWNNGGALTIGTGPAWGSDTARGTGAGTTQIAMLNGLWTNAVSITLRNNSSTNNVAANQATYLCTIRTTGSAQTQVNFKPAAAAGGSNAIIGVYNAYNRIAVRSISRDSTASWTYNSTTPRAADASNSNRISFVDGLQQSNLQAVYKASNNATATAGAVGVGLDVTNAFSGFIGLNSLASQDIDVTGQDIFPPQLGFHFVQALEAASAAATTTFLGSVSPNGQTQGLIVTLEM